MSLKDEKLAAAALGGETAASAELTGTTRAGVYEPALEVDEFTTAPDMRPLAEQPQWRKDFPVDYPTDQYVARRDFAKFLVLTSSAFVAGQGWIAAQNVVRSHRETHPRTKIALVSEVPVQTAKMFAYPDENSPCLLIRTGESTFLAYSQACTHLSCAVVPRIAEGLLHCPCHEGYFDLQTGKNIAGPPPRPLPKIELDIQGDEIYAIGIRQAAELGKV
ncbi:MAG: Rieske 2Fe-2S domain-containing protein [Polyangiaceae bacterium]|nr:Rieske 2Fe-2S domain-containing protein [Polyangiaceae bacterium]